MALSGTAITALTSTFTDTQPALAGFLMAYRESAVLKRLWCTGASAAQSAFDQVRGEKGQQKARWTITSY